MKTKAMLPLLLLLFWLGGCRNDTETNLATLSFAGMVPAAQAAQYTEPSEEIVSTSDVYICKSKGAKKYHLSKTCRGLSNCKHEVVSIKKKDAQNRGLGLCGWED